MHELQYRTNLIIQVVQSTVGLATALLGLGIVFSKTDTLAGWGPAELLAIVGVFTLVSGLTQLVIRPRPGSIHGGCAAGHARFHDD